MKSREKNAILNPFFGIAFLFVCFFFSFCPNDREVFLVADYIYYSRILSFWIK